MLRLTAGSLLLAVALAASAQAQSPVPIDAVAAVPELELEIHAQTEKLAKHLSAEATFEEKKGKAIRESFGLLACLGQALAEHPQKDQSKLNGPALRDAALKFKKNSTYAEAQAALSEAQAVLAGTVAGEHAPLHPWNKLINMHPMMEEMNNRNSQTLKVLKKLKGDPDEVLPAVAWGVLAIAMKADTHEVKNPADLPKWDAFSDEFRAASIKLAAAIKAKDKDEARKWFDKANETCDACHEVFKKE
jgi:hypothetical protein